MTGAMRGMTVDSYQSRPCAAAPSAGEVAGGQGDAEEDQHGASDLPDGDLEALGVEPEQAGQDGQVEPAEQRVGDDLEEGVDGDQQGGALAVAAGEVVPDQHHRDAAREADDDEAGAVLGLVGEEDPGEREHQRRPDDPVQDQRDAEHAAVAVHRADLLVAHLREDGVHHQQQADRDRQGDGADPQRVEGVVEPGDQRSQCQAAGHREGDPQRQEAVERREAASTAASDGWVAVGGHAVDATH